MPPHALLQWKEVSSGRGDDSKGQEFPRSVGCPVSFCSFLCWKWSCGQAEVHLTACHSPTKPFHHLLKVSLERGPTAQRRNLSSVFLFDLLFATGSESDLLLFSHTDHFILGCFCSFLVTSHLVDVFLARACSQFVAKYGSTHFFN